MVLEKTIRNLVNKSSREASDATIQKCGGSSLDFLRSVKKERVVREAIRCLAPPIIDLFRRRHAKKEIKGEWLREERFLS